jgi:uncharacterized DUF497 family protein
VTLLIFNGIRFTWDTTKAATNARKHGVTFAEAVSVFDDACMLVEGQDHAGDPRLVALGISSRSRLLLVIFAEVHHEEIRIISARRAEKRERKAYEGSSREEGD